jgi:hypothetical protein
MKRRDPIIAVIIRESGFTVIARSEATKQSSLYFAALWIASRGPVIGRAFARPVGSQ